MSSTEQQSKSTNVTWHESAVTRAEREELNRHRSCCVWLTGLSGSGKSTVSVHLEKVLTERSIRAYCLDGDNIRHGLNANLGFSADDRTENIRRIGEVSKLFVDAGLIVIAAFISPYRADRDRVRSIMGNGDFVEVHVDCSVEECEKRDVKGLYAKARAGEIPNFTGISAPFEEPLAPEVTIKTAEQSIEDCTQQIIHYLESKKII